MNILMVAPRLPHALGKADSMTVYRIVKFLAPRRRITLACFYESEDELQYLEELRDLCKEVYTVRLKKPQSCMNMLPFNGRSRWPLQVAYYWDREMQGVVDSLITSSKPDLAYAHLIRTGEYLRPHSTVPRILALQISQTLNYRRMIENIRSPFYKFLYTIEYNRVRHYEPLVMKDFDSCLLISRHDKESLEGHQHIHNVFYSPHGVDVEYFTKETNSVERERAVMFCGVLETPTNLDAVTYFHNQIYPLIKREVPDIQFYVVGKNPPNAIKRLAEIDPSVIVTGFVRDIRPYYEKASVGIAPLRIGAGLQNKLLIGMSMELPMVCTSIANEGIAAPVDECVLVADSPQEYAAAVVRLLKDHELVGRIATNGRNYVQSKWTWEYYLEQLEEHMGALMRKG